MYDWLSLFLYGINGVFSGIYVAEFLKYKYSKKLTICVWSVVYFTFQILLFDILQDGYSFNDITKVVINILLLFIMQRIFYHNDLNSQLFVCFSFMAGKEIVKYIASVICNVIGTGLGNVVNSLVLEGKLATQAETKIAVDIIISATYLISGTAYGLMLGAYLFLTSKRYVRKEYKLQINEIIFLLLPSIAALCISITVKMMIISVEDGITTIIYDAVPGTMIWLPIICILMLATIIANVVLFQNVVEYHEENKKRAMLENQIFHMQKEISEIQDIYLDMRGLKHDLRGHINNIAGYVRKHNYEENEELINYINRMEETVDRLEFGYQSGNPIIDIIIHQKLQEAYRNGIKMTVDFSIPKELQIDAYDMGVILNNALDNAIEASNSLLGDKYIFLNSYIKGNLFFVEIENRYKNDIIFHKESNLPKSSKKESAFHGMGLQNIRRCARKYNGEIDIVLGTDEHNEKIFNLTIMLNGKTARM